MTSFAEESIHTERLLLTPLRPADAETMVDVLSDARLHEFIGGQPASLPELSSLYGRLAAGSPDPDEIWRNWIVRLRADDQPVGTVQATVTGQRGHWTVTVAWVIGVPWQAQGFATEAARALVSWLRDEGAETITANIHPEHHSSAKVAAAAGLVATDDEVDGERVWRTTGRPHDRAVHRAGR